jgi:hypothetical protein
MLELRPNCNVGLTLAIENGFPSKLYRLDFVLEDTESVNDSNSSGLTPLIDDSLAVLTALG